MDDDEEEIEISLPYSLPTYHSWNQHATFYHPLMAGSIDGTDTSAHDRAIIRAAKSTYKPNNKVCGDPLKTIMVRHLSRDTKEMTLSQNFSRHGEIKRCRLVRDMITGKSRGYAFIEYKHEQDSRVAVRESRDLVIDDQKVVVDTECERVLSGWVPRRFGGGFGGKKESGQLRFGGIERPFRRPLPKNSKPLGSKANETPHESSKREYRDERRSTNKRFKR